MGVLVWKSTESFTYFCYDEWVQDYIYHLNQGVNLASAHTHVICEMGSVAPYQQ